jgi:hypothetical protein
VITELHPYVFKGNAASRRCRHEGGLDGLGYTWQNQRSCEASACCRRVYAPHQARGYGGFVGEFRKFLDAITTYEMAAINLFYLFVNFQYKIPYIHPQINEKIQIRV